MRIVECGLLMVVALAACAGCEKSGGSGSAVARRDLNSVRGACVIRGRVKFDGTPPVMRSIENKPCVDGAPPLTEEYALVSADGGLQNVFVSVEGVPPIDGAPLPEAVLDQVNCRYVPHAVAVCVGQKLRIRSSDATMHNVHVQADRNESRNLSMTTAGVEKTIAFTAAEMITARCDVHPWMNATIGVFDTPFVAVTGADGSFEIRDLPAGKYRLVAWHERYGRLERPIELTENAAPLSVDLSYQAPR